MDSIYTQLFSQPFPTSIQLVEYALQRHGYCTDEGCFGVTYPDDLDEYDRVIEGQSIPTGMLLINYWDGSNQEVLVQEHDYLVALKEYLLMTGHRSIARFIKTG